MKKLLRKHLKEDEEDEDEAISSYGKRAKEAKEHPKLKNMLSNIRLDEKSHKKMIHKSIGPSSEMKDKIVKRKK